MTRCSFIGHRVRFWSEAETMRWACERGCGFDGSKVYPTATDASRYARALDREDRSDLGRRAPLIGLLPLRIWRRMSDRVSGRDRA